MPRADPPSPTTLLTSTGLTFGSISALFGLTHNVIDQVQYCRGRQSGGIMIATRGGRLRILRSVGKKV
jgi:hypothetical protein